MSDAVMTPHEGRFLAAAVRRKRLFLVLSLAGVAAAVALLVIVLRPSQEGGGSPGLHGLVIVLVLLNARQNLRQYRYACLLEKLRPDPAAPRAPREGEAG